MYTNTLPTEIVRSPFLICDHVERLRIRTGPDPQYGFLVTAALQYYFEHCTVIKVLADFAVSMRLLTLCSKALCDKNFQIEGNGRTFSNIELCNAIAPSDKIL